MKKIILYFLSMSFAAASFAQNGQEPFLTRLKKFENKDNARFIKRAEDVYTGACNLTKIDLIPYTASALSIDELGEPDDKTVAKACAYKMENDPGRLKTLNEDRTVYAAAGPGGEDLVLFLFDGGFGTQASDNGEMMFNVLSKMPYKKENVQAFDNIVAAAANAPDKNLKAIMLAQNGQTGASPLHNIAFYTPLNKNITDAQSAQKNLRPSFQSILLEHMRSDKKFQPYFCDALALKDKNGNNPLNIAIGTGNKEAFYNLVITANGAKCGADLMKKILTDSDGYGRSVKSIAYDNAVKNKDVFYFNTLAMIPGVIDIFPAPGSAEYGAQASGQPGGENKKQIEQHAKNATQADIGLNSTTAATALFGPGAGGAKETGNAAGEIGQSSSGGAITSYAAPGGQVYALDPKNPAQPTADNVAEAQKLLSQDKSFLNDAGVQFNRWKAAQDRFGPDSPEALHAKAEYLKMLEQDPRNPFHSFGSNNNKDTANAFTQTVDGYNSNRLNEKTDKKLQDKLFKCAAQQREMDSAGNKMNTFNDNFKKLQSGQTPLTGEKLANAKRANEQGFIESRKQYYKLQQSILKLQGEIVDASGSRYTGETDCFGEHQNKSLAALIKPALPDAPALAAPEIALNDSQKIPSGADLAKETAAPSAKAPAPSENKSALVKKLEAAYGPEKSPVAQSIIKQAKKAAGYAKLYYEKKSPDFLRDYNNEVIKLDTLAKEKGKNGDARPAMEYLQTLVKPYMTETAVNERTGQQKIIPSMIGNPSDVVKRQNAPRYNSVAEMDKAELASNKKEVEKTYANNKAVIAQANIAADAYVSYLQAPAAKRQKAFEDFNAASRELEKLSAGKGEAKEGTSVADSYLWSLIAEKKKQSGAGNLNMRQDSNLLASNSQPAATAKAPPAQTVVTPPPAKPDNSQEEKITWLDVLGQAKDVLDNFGEWLSMFKR